MPADQKTVSSRWSTTSFAILGLLSVRTWTTYELAKQVKRSLSWFWPRAERKLYDEPKALAAAGLATAEKQYTGQRAGTLYEITPAGREALRRWLDEPPAPPTTEFEAMLKVFFADAGSLDQLMRILDAVAATATERLSRLAGMIEQAFTEGHAFPQREHIGALTLRLGAAQEMAVLDWARWARHEVAAWRSTTDPGTWDTGQAEAEVLADIRRTLAAG
jgi:DNA-binding PadR family transcriptional regulator